MFHAELERKQVYGITFEQGRNELDVNGDLLSNIVTKNKEYTRRCINRYENCTYNIKIHSIKLSMLC